jgi:hypothetical protein
MKKLLLASVLAITSTAALAEDSKGWTQEELSAGVKKYDLSRQLLSGKKVDLGFWGGLNVDCSAQDIEWKVTKAPEHGDVEFSRSTGFLSFPPDNPRSKCGKVKGTAVIYKSKDGYKGEDSFEITGISPAGYAQEITYRLTLR